VREQHQDIGFAVARIAVLQLRGHPVGGFELVTELNVGDAGRGDHRGGLLGDGADEADPYAVDLFHPVLTQGGSFRAL